MNRTFSNKRNSVNQLAAQMNSFVNSSMRPRKATDEDDDEDFQNTGNTLTYYKQGETRWTSRFFLDHGIRELSYYRPLMQELLRASEQDCIQLFFSNSGGLLDTAVSIAEAIKASSGQTVAILTGPCHSASSLLALTCSQIVVSDSATMMIHTASGGTVGKTPDFVKEAIFSAKHINMLLDSTYAGFLNPQEMLELKDGKDFWFNAEEIRARLEIREEILQKELEEITRKAQEPEKPVKAPRKPRQKKVLTPEPQGVILPEPN